MSFSDLGLGDIRRWAWGLWDHTRPHVRGAFVIDSLDDRLWLLDAGARRLGHHNLLLQKSLADPSASGRAVTTAVEAAAARSSIVTK